MSYYRTPEHRRLRADLIRKWRPWESATGPKSAEGKAVVSRNAYKGGYRPLLRAIATLLRENADALKRSTDPLERSLPPNELHIDELEN